MLSARDLYIAAEPVQLILSDGTSQPIQVGTAELSYSTRIVNDVRNLTNVRSYRLDVKLRTRVAGPGLGTLGFSSSAGYLDYPLVWQVGVTPPSGAPWQLLRYTPRTINTVISQSSDSSASTQASFSQQQTTGSSTSNTNTYNLDASLGFFGDDATGSIGGGYSNSSTQEYSQAKTAGSESSTGSSTSSGSSMSIKDWASFAAVDSSGQSVTWTFGQEYPWNGIRDRYQADEGAGKGTAGSAAALPEAAWHLLFGDVNGHAGDIAFPPSELSLFGIDFTMQASWLIPESDALSPISFGHTFALLRGSNYVDGTSDYATIDIAPLTLTVSGPSLDLQLLALDPIVSDTADNGAVTGFLPKHFVAGTSTIVSGSNNLRVRTTGFELTSAPISASVTAASPAKLLVDFKITDPEMPLSLHMKHWQSGGNPCVLAFTFNGDSTNTITMHVDAAEGEGGNNNLLSMDLRNTSYASIDYHDYLVLGRNTIEIDIAPADGASSAVYVLRALALS